MQQTNKHHFRLIPLSLAILLITTSCSNNSKQLSKKPKEESKQAHISHSSRPINKRYPAHNNHDHSKLHHSHNSLFDDTREIDPETIIHKYKGAFKVPPLRYLSRKVTQGALGVFLKTLPLEREVRSRIIKSMNNKDFSNVTVPFLLAMKSAYLASSKSRKNNFNNYILSIYPDKNQLPGLEHSHFHYPLKKRDKKKEQEKSEGLPKEVIAGAIKIFDIVFLKDGTFKLGEPPKRNLNMIGKLKDEIQSIIRQMKNNTEDALVSEVLDNLVKDNDRLEAMSVTLVDFIGIFTFNHFKMFANRFSLEEKMQIKMQEMFDQDYGDKLWDWLEYELYQKKYGVQVIVDGLQGQLIEALVSGDQDHPFIQNVVKEHLNQEQYKPKNINTYEPAGEEQLDFLLGLANKSINLKKLDYLNFFKELYSKNLNGVVKRGISTTPTISVRNLPMIQTGAPVVSKDGGTGIPTFHYLDRKKEQAFYFWGNDAIMLDELTSKAGMKTLFERMPDKFTMNCMATYETGANWSINPLLNVALGEKMRDFGEIICLDELESRIKTEAKIRKLKVELLRLGMRIRERRFKDQRERKVHLRKAQRLINKIASYGSDGLPDLLVLYSPWPDHNAHFTGPFSDEILSPTGELNRLDFWLGRLTKVYQEAKVEDRTIFNLVGDHGLTPTKYLIKAEVQIFDELIKEGYQIKTWKLSSDEGEGPKIRNHLHKERVRGYDVMTASTGGGNFQIELFVDQDKNWSRQPIYKEAANLTLQSGQVLNVPHEIVTRLEDTLEYGAIREEASDFNNTTTRLFAMRDGKRIDEIIYRRQDKIFYQHSYNLLETNQINRYDYEPKAKELEQYSKLYTKCMEQAKYEELNTWCESSEWRELTSYTNKPDSVVQIAHLFDIDIAGTIHLFSKPYIGFNSLVSGRHAGELFHEKDAFLAIWGGGVKYKTRLRSEEITTSAPTIYEYMTGTKIKKGHDGWGAESLLIKAD